MFLHWYHSGELPARTFYELDITMALWLLALQEEVADLIEKRDGQ